MEFKKRARPVPTETTPNTSSSNVQDRSTGHCQLAFAAHNSVTPQNSVIEETVVKGQCPCHTSGQFQTLRCSSSDLSEQVGDDSDQFSDLENERVEDTEWNNRIEQVKDDSNFSDLEASSSEVDVGLIGGKELEEVKGKSYYRTIEDKTTFETEMEEFIASAENDILHIFIQKYNYDFSKDVPLEGRYEWVRIDQRRLE